MSSERKFKHLYIPIEIKVREFDAKLLFSLVAAERGFRVVLGGQKDLRTRVAWWPEGIYLDKSVADTKLKWFKYFRKFGHKVVAWDEEGLIIHPDSYLERRFSSDSFALVEKFFAWGDFHSKVILEKYGSDREKVVVVGNPRLDMLRPEFLSYQESESNKIAQEYGKTILINTNFSFYNHIVDKEEGKRRFLRNHPEMTETFIENWIDYQKEIFQAFIDLLPALQANFPDYSVILRPHPAENQDRWKTITAKQKNVHVVHKNNVTEWIQAADVMIHSNCTTGVESFLLNVPCIAFQPVRSEQFDTYLPNALSSCASNLEEVIELVRRSIENGDQPTATKEKLEEAHTHIESISGQLSCEKIVHHLDLLDVEPTEVELSLRQKSARLVKELTPFLKRELNLLKDHRIQGLRGSKTGKSSALEIKQQIHEQTIPDITLEEIESGVVKFRACMQKFKSVSVQDLGNGCFEIISN